MRIGRCAGRSRRNVQKDSLYHKAVSKISRPEGLKLYRKATVRPAYRVSVSEGCAEAYTQNINAVPETAANHIGRIFMPCRQHTEYYKLR